VTAATLRGDVRVRIAVIWLASRVVVVIAAVVGSWSLLKDSGFANLWFRWDTQWFDSIARYGYVGPLDPVLHRDFAYNVAFFPGLPLLMKAGMWLSLTPVVTGLAVSFVAGYIAALALGRLMVDRGGDAELAVLGWVLAPTALFLFVPYTEALFCALAFWAWYLAKRGSWMWAGFLAGGAALVRVNGLFLGVGLVVMFALASPRRWSRAPFLLIPFAATAGYLVYLKAITGSWHSWQDAERIYWHRTLTDPVHAFAKTLSRMFDPADPHNSASVPSRFLFEILAMIVIVIVAVWLFKEREWPELVYLAVTGLSLATSNVYLSVPRTLVVLFPVWIALGVLLTRRRWLVIPYAVLASAALVFWTIRFTQGLWVS
jgi:hypothetical protein